MAEYKSFHYLMHSIPDTIQPHYISNTPVALTPLSFSELYSPRDRLKIAKTEKSFWRTRDRIEFHIYEDRKEKILIITCYNIEGQIPFRTIFLNLEILYNEIEYKLRGNERIQLTKKSDKKLDNSILPKQVSDYVIARLNIGQASLPWPSFGSEAIDHSERMCTFDKLSSDEWENMEIPPPFGMIFEGIDHLKLSPTLTVLPPSPIDSPSPNPPDQGAAGATTPNPTSNKNPTNVKVAPAPAPTLQQAQCSTTLTRPRTGTKSAPHKPNEAKMKPTGGKGKKVVPIG
jgi:hypothetical protein